MVQNTRVRSGLRFSWVDEFDNQVKIVDSEELQNYIGELCKSYGVSCKVFETPKYYHTKETDRYVVLSIYRIPDNLSVKQIYIRNERSTWLFYLDYHVVKIDSDSDMLSVLDSAHDYCKTADFLRRLFSEFKAPLPNVIHGAEIGGLKAYNQERINPSLPLAARMDYQKGLQKFFKQETTKSKYLQKWRAFSRTDKYNRKSSYLKMFWDFYRRDDPIVPLELLMESNDHIRQSIINEHEFVVFKKEMKQRYPEVIFSVSKIEVQNEGFDKRRNKHKPISKIKDGPFGKLVTYKAYCEEREKRFAEEGYDAILNLVPAYYETRQLFYREIDEPIIAGVLNSIRFAYAKSEDLHRMYPCGLDIFNIIDIPIDDMQNFVSLARRNHILYHIDFIGRFGAPNFDRLSIAYPLMDADKMRSVVERLVNEKFQYDRIETTPEKSNKLGVKNISR